MIGKLKTLGLALVAIGAVGAVIASAASAGALHLGANPSVITAQNEPGQQHVATIPGPPTTFNIPCETATFEGTAFQEGVQTQTIQVALVTPTFTQCKIAGVAATVQMNGCKYTATGAGQAANTFLIDIVGCTAGKQVQVKTATCIMDMPEQNGLSHIVMQNIEGTPNKKITLEATVSGVTEVQTGAACPHGNNAHASNAAISGSTTAQAFADAGAHQVTLHGHQYSAFTHQGAAVELITT
jgi:hypothetical protein